MLFLILQILADPTQSDGTTQRKQAHLARAQVQRQRMLRRESSE